MEFFISQGLDDRTRRKIAMRKRENVFIQEFYRNDGERDNLTLEFFNLYLF